MEEVVVHNHFHQLYNIVSFVLQQAEEVQIMIAPTVSELNDMATAISCFDESAFY